MTHTIPKSKYLAPGSCYLVAALLFILVPTVSFALTPIARVDVVPYQRIEYGSSFNFGVVAFSKAGIDRVEFTITGQGYSGGVQTASSMTYNSRTDVYEYWVPLKSSDFSTDGPVSIQVDVFGNDGGTRDLGSTPLMVNATGNLPQPKAWVSNSGNDSTGAVNNNSKPFSTVGGAVSAIQAANGGSSDGGIIYLKSGTYNLGNGSVNTTREWLTITRDAGATKENTIINSSGSVRTTNLLKVDGVTLQSQGNGQYVFISGGPTNLWVNDCRLIGSGRWVANSNPVHHSSTSHYSTDNYIYNSDYAYRKAALVRGANIVQIGNDAFENTPFVVNATTSGITNGTTTWHADAFQTFTGTSVPPPDNRIVYNYKATDIHYEGFFMRSDTGTATDNAFVNVFVELREPADKNELGTYAFMAFSVNQSWDHLLVWNSTFLTGHSPVAATLTNSSFIGNLFYQYVDEILTTPIGNPVVTYAQNGNTANNEFLYNHFMYVYGESPACTPNTRFISNNWPCPHRRAKIPDSHASGSATTGEGVIDLADPSSNSFGMPVEGSVLIDRIPFPTVPADVYGTPRVGNPDVGAMEKTSTQTAPPPLTTPVGFQKL